MQEYRTTDKQVATLLISLAVPHEVEIEEINGKTKVKFVFDLTMIGSALSENEKKVNDLIRDLIRR